MVTKISRCRILNTRVHRDRENSFEIQWKLSSKRHLQFWKASEIYQGKDIYSFERPVKAIKEKAFTRRRTHVLLKDTRSDFEKVYLPVSGELCELKKIIRYVENSSVRPSMRSLPNINGQTVCRILYIT
jgi:hypothetical protein